MSRPHSYTAVPAAAPQERFGPESSSPLFDSGILPPPYGTESSNDDIPEDFKFGM